MRLGRFRIWQIIGILISTISFIWFFYHLITHLSAFSNLKGMALPYIISVILVSTFPAFFLGISWWLLMRDAGEKKLSVYRAISICCLAQMGKYLPGNVGQHIGRVALAKRYGLGTILTLFTMFMETIWVIAIAAILSLSTLLVFGSRVFAQVPHIPPWWALASLIVVSMLAPVAGHRVFESTARWWSKKKGIQSQLLQMPSLATFWLVGFLHILNFIILGLVLLILASQVFQTQNGNIFMLTGIFALAWIAGFITPGSPAGFGVREVIIVMALTPVYGSEIAIGITAMLRVVTVLGDGLVFLTGLLLTQIFPEILNQRQKKLHNGRHDTNL